MLELEFSNLTPYSINAKDIERHLESILRALKHVDRVITEVTIVSEDKITQLNHRWRGLNSPTDVLSFGVAQGDPREDFIGSMTICAEVASRQAASGGVSLITEIQSLSSHAMLHLLGYNHK